MNTSHRNLGFLGLYLLAAALGSALPGRSQAQGGGGQQWQAGQPLAAGTLTHESGRGDEVFHGTVQPFLKRYCTTCHRTSKKKGGVILTVADDGPGLPEEDGGKVLESFFSTKPEGTGLGLSVVKQVADSHGWKFELRSDPDGGAVNVITIPAQGLERG